MNTINWQSKSSKIIFVIIIILLLIVIGLKIVIKDIKHNSDEWYMVEDTRYDYTQLTIESYEDKGFLQKTIHSVYDVIQPEPIYTVPGSEIKLLFNGKAEGKMLEGIIDINIVLDNEKVINVDFTQESTYILFNAPQETGEHEYKLKVTYDNKDIAIYVCKLKVATSEEIKEIKYKNIIYTEKENVEIQDKDYSLEMVGLNSEGNLNYTFNKLDKVAKIENLNLAENLAEVETFEEKIKDEMYINKQKSENINVVFSEEVGKFIIKQDIDASYYYINEESVQSIIENNNNIIEETEENQKIKNIQINKNKLSKDDNGVYQITLPEQVGKYVLVVETSLGNYYNKINILNDKTNIIKNMDSKYSALKLQDEAEIKELVADIVNENLITKLPDLEKVEPEIDLENKTITIKYYFNTKEIDPEKLGITEEFNTKVKEEIAIYLYKYVYDLNNVININYTKQGKNKLQHEQQYNEIQIKQIFDRI